VLGSDFINCPEPAKRAADIFGRAGFRSSTRRITVRPFTTGAIFGKYANDESETQYTGFDVAGRITESKQITDGLDICTGTSSACKMSYQYNLVGMLTEQTYPSGRIVHHNYGADGKLTAVSSRLAANKASKSYAQNFSYNAAGAVTDMQLGNMRWEHTEFNARMQPTKIALGTTAGDDDLLNLVYGYGTTANNGNVLSQTIKVENVGATQGFEAVQTYTYDEVNRLKSATEMSTPNSGGSATQSWKQTYSFDRFGNRRFDTTSGATTTIPGTCSTAECNPTFNPANNRFAGSQGYVYDSAGNVTEDANGKKFAYDAENKQKSFGTGGSSTNGGASVYDGGGRRVKKTVGTEVTIFVYDVSGQMVAEYATTAPTSPQINYLTADTLGTPRINTDGSGSVLARHDYMPFGEEIFTNGNRASGLVYGSDGIRQQFTGYERDVESGLDYAKARMFGSGLGRFTSPDDFLSDTNASEPQSWNLYVYVKNNPLRFIDPTGEIQRDANGKIIFVPDKVDKKTQKPKERPYIYTTETKPDGSIVVTKWNVIPGKVFAKNGTPIVALKKTSAVSVEVTNSNGFVNQKESQKLTQALQNVNNSSDCHGTTFADGEVWIENDQVEKIITNDGYRPLDAGEKPESGDVGIYAEGKKFDLSNAQHSVTVSTVDKEGQVVDVISKGGDGPRRTASPGPGPGTAWDSANNMNDKKHTQLQYFTQRVKQ
jgi:RHS repeat-associated protein